MSIYSEYIDIQNQEISTHYIKNQEISNQFIENHFIKNQFIENQKIENLFIKNKIIQNQKIQKQDIQKQYIQNSIYSEFKKSKKLELDLEEFDILFCSTFIKLSGLLHLVEEMIRWVRLFLLHFLLF